MATTGDVPTPAAVEADDAEVLDAPAADTAEPDDAEVCDATSLAKSASLLASAAVSKST
jgi:hypothetical protein